MRRIMKRKNICLFLALLLSVCAVIGIGSTVSKYTAKSDVAAFDVTFMGGNHTLQPGMAINRLIDELQETTKARKIVFGSYNELGVANNIAWNDESAIEMGELAGDFRAFPITEEDGTAAIYILAAGSNKVIANPDSSWMFWYSGLTQIEGLENLDTSNVTDMSHMFHNLSSIKTLDLSGFDTSKVENMKRMFYDCTSLTTVYVGEKWSTDAVTNSEQMFTYAKKLVGGQGTVYNQSYVDKTYARIDEKVTSGTPGYLSLKEYILKSGSVLNEMFNEVFDRFSPATTITFGSFNDYKDSLDFSWNDYAEELGVVNDTIRLFYDENKNCYVLAKDSGKIIANEDCSGMFKDIDYLKAIVGLEKLNTSNVKNMSYMFYNCENLTSLDVSCFDTSKVTDMNNMFYNCYELTSIDVSGFDTSSVDDMSHMFERCGNLTSLDVSGFDTSSVDDMSHMFERCGDFTSLNVSNFDTRKVTDMSYMFCYCDDLTSLDVSSFDTSKVTNMSDMFSYCKGLTSLDISSFDTSKVTDMSNMFSYCEGLTSLNLSDINTSNVDNMSCMFKQCYILASLDLSGFNTSKVTNMSGMFYRCYALTSLDLSNFDTSNVTSMTEMFHYCSGLTSLDLSGFNTKNVKYMSNMFSFCKSLTTLNLSGFNTSNVLSMHYMFGYSSMLTVLDLSSFDTSNVTTMSYMFHYCESLTTIYVSDLWNTESVTSGDNMFNDCKNIKGGKGTTLGGVTQWHSYYARIDGGESAPGYLTLKGTATLVSGSEFNSLVGKEVTKITFGNFDDYASIHNFVWENGKAIDAGKAGQIKLFKEGTEAFVLGKYVNFQANSDCSKMFNEMESLTEIIGLNLLDTSNVTNMSYMFAWCKALTQLDLSNFNTSNVTKMDNMFWLCEKLEKIDVSSFDTSSVDNMDSMFMACETLTNLDVSNFNTSNVTDMDFMFSFLSQIKILDLSNFDTSNVTTTVNMFINSSTLETIYVGENWDMNLVNNSNNMFMGCTNLVGGNGTTYDGSMVDATYARIDGGTENPGYLTKK